MRICPKCGSQHPDDITQCPHCNTDIRKKSAKKRLIIGVVATVYAVISIVAVLALTDVICINHDWQAASCTEAKTCKSCGKIQGDALGHDWQAVSCTSAKTCNRCNLTEGAPLGHTKGDWEVTESPTLSSPGKESLPCKTCGLVLESRVLDKKKPMVTGKTFNFSESEALEWIKTILPIDVEMDETMENGRGVTYSVTAKNGEVGAINLGYGANNDSKNVCGIMIYFNDTPTAISLVSDLAQAIDSRFSKAEASIKLFADRPYSKADMTVLMHQIDGLYTAVLMPYEYYTTDWFKTQ